MCSELNVLDGKWDAGHVSISLDGKEHPGYQSSEQLIHNWLRRRVDDTDEYDIPCSKVGRDGKTAMFGRTPFD